MLSKKRLKFFCLSDGASQRTEFVVHLLQFILLVALCHDTSASLEPQFAITRDEGADGDGLVQRTVESDDADAAAVSTAVVWLVLRDELHGTNLWSTAQCASRECVDEGLDGIGTRI